MGVLSGSESSPGAGREKQPAQTERGEKERLKTRVANMLICRKFDSWLESIECPATRNMVNHGTILTGEAIVTLLTENRVNDFDFYFRDRETALAVATYYVAKFKENPPQRFRSGTKVDVWVAEEADRVKIMVKSAGIVGETRGKAAEYAYFESDPDATNQEEFLDAAVTAVDEAKSESEAKEKKPKYRPLYLTSNAISLSDKVQIVIRFFGDPAEIHANYDFVHCTNYWTSWERRVTTNADALECILTKELRYIGSRYPICSLFRVRKFVERGWTITAGQMLKIVWQASKLDLSDVKVLEDQLTGVDVAYFMQVIDALKERDPARVDDAYLFSLIDRRT